MVIHSIIWRILTISMVPLLISCTEKSANQKAMAKPDYSKEFQVLEAGDNDIAGLVYKGKLIALKAWEDANGHNFLILSTKESEKDEPESGDSLVTRELFAYHYAKQGSKTKLLRKFQDWEKECFFDNRARFVKQAISITDLNNNNMGEALFMYRLGCTSEYSPDNLKLILTENGSKHAIRGTTMLDGQQPMTGEGVTNIDPSLENASSALRDHALTVWTKFQDHARY